MCLLVPLQQSPSQFQTSPKRPILQWEYSQRGTGLSGNRDTGLIQQADQMFFENIHLGLDLKPVPCDFLNTKHQHWIQMTPLIVAEQGTFESADLIEKHLESMFGCYRNMKLLNKSTRT